MNLRQRLRQVSRWEAALRQQLAHVPGGEIAHTSAATRYLQLELTDDAQQRAQGWMDVDAWAAALAPELPGIAWEQVPLSYLAHWLRGRQPYCRVAGKMWSIRRIDIPAAPPPASLIRLPAQPAPLLCSRWPERETATSMDVPLWLDEIPFELRYVLGRSRLALPLLLDAAEGDLIRIECYDPQLKVGHCPCFRFCVTEDLEVFVEERYHDAEHEALRAEEELIFEWSTLPVDIEFVLANVSLAIGELDSLQPGAQLPLAMDAEKKIKIYVNRKLFARGELIALDDGSLAVEVNQLNTIAEHAGHPYAE